MEVSFTSLPIVGAMACTVPVLPGTPITMRDGEPISLDERTERCATWARWMIGMQPLCDHHLQETCVLLEIDVGGVLAEAERGYPLVEWPDGERDQAMAERTHEHFAASAGLPETRNEP